MKIVMNSWFRLPFVGKDVYADLMKAKVKRDTRLGFRFTSETNVSRALTILSNALDEPVELAKACFICDGALEDEPEGSSPRTICIACEENPDSFDLYVMKFAKLMETV